ncbi:MAG TPA: gephyrin-like molybdotransferase Glp [Terriglobales bacterium]|nr:gephyrin-like molybdotransferase Glp [Terriglobales bacterium]
MSQPRSLTYAQARERVLAATRPGAIERVSLAAARGRALRESIVAAHALPPFDNPSMDGWAVRAADLASASPEAPVVLPVTGVIAAGVAPRGPLAPGRAVRIMTGALLPEGADAVIAFEDAEEIGSAGGPDEERVRFARPARERENVRPAGADLAAGAVALEEGRELSAHDVALLAAIGEAEVPVGARPRAAILSAGDELLEPGEPLRPGAIRDSNRPQLAALLEECGALVVFRRRVGDDPRAVTAAVREALEGADVVLTIGGISAGDFDPVKQSLGALGEIEHWRVAIRPGKPQAFGTPGGKLFFGLPGNPGSVACTFEVFVRPALRKLQGFSILDRPILDVRAGARVPSAAGRRDFVRATLEVRDGTWWASPAGPQVSGYLTPQSRAHALLVVPEEAAELGPGDRAQALLLRWPGSSA